MSKANVLDALSSCAVLTQLPSASCANEQNQALLRALRCVSRRVRSLQLVFMQPMKFFFIL